MNNTTGEAVLREFLAHNPAAERAALHDPQYAAEVHRLLQVLVQLDRSLTAEGLPATTRRRVEAQLVTAYLGTDEARARLHHMEQLAARDTVRMPAGL